MFVPEQISLALFPNIHPSGVCTPRFLLSPRQLVVSDGVIVLRLIYKQGMVLLELITRKKIGEDGFARRTPAKLFALEAEEIKQEAPPDAPESLLNLAAGCVQPVKSCVTMSFPVRC